jgi:hypothetical protein
MASIIRAKYAGPGQTFWGRRKSRTSWWVAMDCRAIREGWLITMPEKRAEVLDRLLDIALDPEARHADSIAAAKTLIQTELSIAKLDQDEQRADAPQVMVTIAPDSTMVAGAELLRRLGLARAEDTLLPAPTDAAPSGLPAHG